MNRILVPTGNAGGFAFILAVMWYVGMGQGNGAAYLLFFLLLGVLIVSVPKTFLNLTALRVAAESIKPAFAGQELSLPVEIVNLSKRSRCALSVSLPGTPQASAQVDEISAGHAARAVLSFPAVRRGEHEISTVTLSSIWPIGFFKAGRNTALRQTYLVYPKPAGDPCLPRRSQDLRCGGDSTGGGRFYRGARLCARRITTSY